MKRAVTTLDGPWLDAAVAKAAGLQYRMNGHCFANPDADQDEPQDLMCTFEPSCHWDAGGPIIEREQITTEHEGGEIQADSRWTAGRDDAFSLERGWSFGPTLLIAAMRFYVRTKLGDEVDL